MFLNMFTYLLWVFAKGPRLHEGQNA